MRIFLSHSSRQKPLVREIRTHLPSFLATWLDEDHLLFGDDIAGCIRDAIAVEADYVVLFLDQSAAQSQWVHREVAWALEAERQSGRTFLLPVLLEKLDLTEISGFDFRARKYLQLQDFQESSVLALGKGLGDALFALVCRDMQRLHNPEMRTAFSKIRESDALLHQQAALLQRVVFPHRAVNPITIERLLGVVNSHNRELLQIEELDEIITAVIQRNLIPGLSYDGDVAFLVEEHAQWKRELHHDKKERLGKKAAALVANGAKVMIDAGSTAEEIVRVLCKRIENRLITRLTVATTSVNIADMISDCCVRMGFDDDFSAVTLLVPGGRIRPNTQAIVPLGRREQSDLRTIADEVGGFDIGFVGVNGIDTEGGFTTHANAERWNKADILAACERRFIVGDSSKVGIVLEERFASFADDVRLVIDDDPEHLGLADLKSQFPDKLILA